MTAFNENVAFVHIPKTAGHSCRRYMHTHLPGMREIDDAFDRSAGHVALRDWEKFTGRDPRSYERIIAVVRDPYEQQLSKWLFWKDCFAQGYRMLQYEHASLHANLTYWLMDPMSDWHVHDDRVVGGQRKTVTRRGEGFLPFGGYYLYWLAMDGEIPDNVRIVRFENLTRDFPHALREYTGGDTFDMEHANKGPRYSKRTKDYYTRIAREIVEAKFAWSFECLYERWG